MKIDMEETDIFLQNVREEYNEAVASRNWDEVRKVGLKLQEAGFPEVEMELSETLTKEELEDFWNWDTAVNGTTETQMDDNS